MKFKLRRLHAFSLVELTLAIGVAAFCLIAVFGLVPVGIQTSRNATFQTAATSILSSAVSDIRASPPEQHNTSLYQIRRSKGNSCTVCFDGQAKPTGTPMALDVACTNPNSVYRLFVRVDNTTTTNFGAMYPAHAYLRLTWPALAPSPAPTPSGSVQTVTDYYIKAP